MKHKAYMLSTVKANMTSYRGIIWPRSGWVEFPDWKPEPDCWDGLHGLLWGEGDGRLLNWSDRAVWIVAGIDEWIDLGGNVKAPRAEVVYAGDRKGATDLIIRLGATGAVVGANIKAGDGANINAGYKSTLTVGDWSNVTAKGGIEVSAGKGSTVTVILETQILEVIVGEGGLKPDTPYAVKDGKFVEKVK